MPATKRFYGSVFGWSFTDYGPDYVAFDSAGRSGGFNAERKVVADGGPLVVLFAADLDAMEAKVRAARRGDHRPLQQLPRRPTLPFPRSQRQRNRGLDRTN